MKHVDGDKIWKVFNVDGETQVTEYTEEGVKEKPTDLTYLIGLVRGLEAYHTYAAYYAEKFKEAYYQKEEWIKGKYFELFYNYVVALQLKDSDLVSEAVSDLTLKQVSSAFKELMDYFQELEEYERCALILKKQQQLKKLI